MYLSEICPFDGVGKFFSLYNVPSLKELRMCTQDQFFLLRWINNYRQYRKIKKDRKKTAYYEKLWDMKLRGIRR